MFKYFPNAFKALDDMNISWLLLIYNHYWQNQANFDKWHEVQEVHVPLKVNTSNPKKFIGVTLINVGNKIYSSIMCGQLFNIISKNGVKCRFGSTPGVGCQDGTFTIKTILHMIHNHNLPIWVLFSDLFKAFDTSNNSFLITILEKYGAPL